MKLTNETGAPLRPERRSNIELLRILAMLGIIIFHHFGDRNINLFLTAPEGFSNSNYLYDIVTNGTAGFDFRAVLVDFAFTHFGNGGNLIFMLITGYFLFGRPSALAKRIRSVGKLLLVTVFWGCALTAFFMAVTKLCYPIAGVTAYRPWFNLPVWLSGSNMWYFQAYGVFLLVIVPILKYFEPKVDQKRHRLLICTFVFLMFLDYKTYLPDIWISSRLLEFTACYYIGGYIGKYGIRLRLRHLTALFAGYVAAYLVYQSFWRIGMRKLYTPSEYSAIGMGSPVICYVIFAVLVFAIFSKLNFRSKVINHIAKAVPGIYVFHYQMVALCLILGYTGWWSNWSVFGYITFILIDTAALFVGGYGIDQLRQLLDRTLWKWIDRRKSKNEENT